MREGEEREGGRGRKEGNEGGRGEGRGVGERRERRGEGEVGEEEFPQNYYFLLTSHSFLSLL